MRQSFVCGLLAAVLMSLPSFAQSKAEGTASISGVVKGAAESPTVVYLQSSDANPTRYYDGYQVSAEKDGSFSFAEIKPGTYRIRAEASGFMSAMPDGEVGTRITLRAHEKRKGVTIAMVHLRALCGLVTEEGTPKQTWVEVFRYDPEVNMLYKTSPQRVLTTEKDGRYSFTDLAPGTYYLRAYMTWYPGAYSFSDAKPLIVGAVPEAERCLFDIPLQYTGCRATKVTGRIAASPDDGDARYRVNFLEHNTAGGSMPARIDMGSNSTYKAGDEFSTQVCAGTYDVVLSDQQASGGWNVFPATKVVFDSQAVTVGQTEINGVMLTPHAMASIKGEVHFESISRNEICPGLGGQRVSLHRKGDGQFQSVDLDAKNHFEIKNVAPGEYTIYLGPLRRGAVYLKSITVDGKAIEGRHLSITRASQTMVDITLSGDLANAEGHVSADLWSEPRWEVAWTRPKGVVAGRVKGDVDGGYTVKLRSVRYNSNASLEYAVHTVADGNFHFDAVDPGVYTLRAESEGGSLTSEYGALGFGQQGTPIIVRRGARLDGFTLAPPKLGTICGRVTDASGAPKDKMRIFIETFNGYLHGRDKAGEFTTNSDGRFRVQGLSPGEYFPAFPSGDRTLFFSSDGSLTAATPLSLPAGEDIGCGPDKPIELRVPADIDKWYAISGQVLGDIPASVGNRFWISLLWDVEGPANQTYVTSAKLDSEHQFRIERVPKGRFLLELHSAYGPEPQVWSGPYGPVSHLLASQRLSGETTSVFSGDLAYSFAMAAMRSSWPRTSWTLPCR
jgi:protocatechuate 3,4-dioxygenase beta subunit